MILVLVLTSCGHGRKLGHDWSSLCSIELSWVVRAFREPDPTQLNQLSWVELGRALWTGLNPGYSSIKLRLQDVSDCHTFCHVISMVLFLRLLSIAPTEVTKTETSINIHSDNSLDWIMSSCLSVCVSCFCCHKSSPYYPGTQQSSSMIQLCKQMV